MIKFLAIFMIAAALVSCNKKSGTDDLQQFTKDAFKNRKPEIDPLPALKPVSVFIYQASKEKDPFNKANLRKQKVENTDTGGGEQGPDLTRRKEPLEAYPTDSLRLVGVMQPSSLHNMAGT